MKVFIKRVSLHGLIPRSDWPLEEVGGFPGIRYLSQNIGLKTASDIYFGIFWGLSILCLSIILRIVSSASNEAQEICQCGSF